MYGRLGGVWGHALPVHLHWDLIRTQQDNLGHSTLSQSPILDTKYHCGGLEGEELKSYAAGLRHRCIIC